MTISGLSNPNPNAALGRMPVRLAGTPLPGYGAAPTSLGDGSSTVGLSGSRLDAASGAAERPGIGNRLVSAMRAAVAELRGQGASEAQVRNDLLAMQAHGGVEAARPISVAKPASQRAKTARQVQSARSWQSLAPRAATPGAVAGPARAAAGMTSARMPGSGMPGASMPTAAAVPANAMQLPGGTVYSYDQSGNPIASGMQGLDPVTLQQLGVHPSMLGAASGLAQAVDREGPQVNATNQTSLGLGSTGVYGTPRPVLGAPIVVPTGAPVVPTSSSSGPPQPPGVAGVATGGEQRVVNENSSDAAQQYQNPYGWNGGWGGASWGDPTGGIATPYAPYGASMNGAPGLLQRWLG